MFFFNNFLPFLKMSSEDKRRLLHDFRRLKNDPPVGISASPEAEDIMKWNAVIFGPEGTVWEDGVFKLTLQFPENYPHKAPEVKFITPVFHPNVYVNGAICLDILQSNWSPAYDIAAILTSIQSLLTDPNHLLFLKDHGRHKRFRDGSPEFVVILSSNSHRRCLADYPLLIGARSETLGLLTSISSEDSLVTSFHFWHL